MKNVLITGTSSGFGKVMAEHLTKKGYNVIGTSRTPDKVKATYKLFQLDVRNDESVNAAIERFTKEVGNIDVLINNAGNGLAGAIEDTSIEEAKAQLETNFFGVVRVTKTVLPKMRAQKSGLIINISSIGGLIGLPFQGFYSASKFALEGYTEALRMEMKPFNIQIINVNPGDFKTDFTNNRVVVKAASDTYKNAFEKVLSIYKREEEEGSEPIDLAIKVERLINKEKGYRVRYLVGNPLQRLGACVKRLVGSKLFEKIMEINYKL